MSVDLLAIGPNRGSLGWYPASAFGRALGSCGALGAAARAQAVDRSKTLEGFGESRRGDVPEGTPR